MNMNKQKPLRTFQAGSVRASVWDNQVLLKDGSTASMPRVCVERRYKDCDALGRALCEYVENHRIDAPDDLDENFYLDDQFTIKKIEPGKLHLDALLDGEDDIEFNIEGPKRIWSASLVARET